jgi:hypothetical protein
VPAKPVYSSLRTGFSLRENACIDIILPPFAAETALAGVAVLGDGWTPPSSTFFHTFKSVRADKAVN